MIPSRCGQQFLCGEGEVRGHADRHDRLAEGDQGDQAIALCEVLWGDCPPLAHADYGWP